MFEPIIAGFENNHQKLNVLFVAINPSTYQHALIMAQNSAFNCFILTEIAEKYILNSQIGDAKIIRDYKECIAILHDMDRLIIPFFHIAPGYPNTVKKIIALAIRNHIPIISVPHGLFEPRRNIADTSPLISASSQIFGQGDRLRSVADCSLSWYEGDNAIGYPLTMVKRGQRTRILPSYTLITTNTNWYLYHFKDERRLFEALFSFIERHSERLFIWAMHPAESSPDNPYAQFAKKRCPQNLLIYGFDDDIYFHDIDMTEDLIFHCETAIATTTTCLLDFELYNKPVHIFECDGTKALTDSLKQASFFQTAVDLEKPAKPIVTGYLKKYRPDLFDKYVREATVTLGIGRAFLFEASAS